MANKRLIFEVEEKPERGTDAWINCRGCPFLVEGDGWFDCNLDFDRFGIPCQEYDMNTLKFIGEYEENTKVQGRERKDERL